jgi:hypothetical protein
MRRTTVLAFAFLLVMQGAGGCSELETLSNSKDHIAQFRIVDQAEFTESNVLALARQFVSDNHDRLFASLWIGTDRDRLRYYISGKGVIHSSTERWLSRLTDSVREGWDPVDNIAEVDVIAGDAVLRARINSSLKRVVLTQRDPLVIVIQERKYEILYFVVRPVNSIHRREREAKFRVSLFVRVHGTLCQGQFHEFARRIARLSPQGDFYIGVREDNWFDAEDFPMAYAFEGPITVPTVQEYEDGRHIGTWIRGGSREVEIGEGGPRWVDPPGCAATKTGLSKGRIP